jgi:hypothetical protein
MWSCLGKVSILFVHSRAMLAMEGKSVMPSNISTFGVKEEVQLKVPKQSLDKVCVGMAVL